MEEIRLIDIKEEILSENKGLADQIRQKLAKERVFLLNLMGSPGSGKTSLILKTIESLGVRYRIAVVEADIDSSVDSEKVAAQGIRAVQIRTGGFCHVDAAMMEKALDSLPLGELDLIILENVGNLVCPAETDTGAVKNVVLLSVPEGDDKPLKYPLIFTVCDALVINKIDYMELADFDLGRVAERASALNAKIRIFNLSCRTSTGLGEWIGWLEQELAASLIG
ncbi:MAG TPA: hydrogenase nickel incorporation protein HypB [Anaerolineae bacterium]|jgi:hydrogenase nickel incorporation protein HypB|nr:hydrogenase nickel incorporation protein HypB [Anaerolineae bacterium]